MKKFLLAALSLVTVAVVSITGTVAFLQDEKSDVNVMTTGNVYIEQIEQERDENGNLVPFTQAKAAYPAVGSIAWDDQLLNVNGTACKVFDDGLKNVIDKIVTVNNTGKSDAYVRTVVAIEAPEGDPNNLIHVGFNEIGIETEGGFVTKIDGVDYFIMAFVYEEALAAGAKSAPSLMQVFLDAKATNEYCAKFGATWEILVVSQAVQTAGFADAKTALNAAFGKTSEKAAEWFGGENFVIPDAVVASADEFKKAIAKGGNVMLTDDIELTGTLVATKDAVIDLNGNKVTAPSSGAMFQSQSNASPDITITSSAPGAEINVAGGDTSVLLGYGKTVIKNVTINVTGCDNATPNPFKVYGDLTLGEGTVVNVDYLGTALISNNGAHKIVIDGAKINIGTFKTNGTAIITLNNSSTLEMKNTAIKIGEFVLSSFGGDSLVSKVDGVTIDGCTFNVTDSNGASCTFEAKDGKYRLVQK